MPQRSNKYLKVDVLGLLGLLGYDVGAAARTVAQGLCAITSSGL